MKTLSGRVVRYAIAGLLATLVYFAAVAALVEVAGVPPVPAAALGTVVVIFTSYVVNRLWVFDTDLSHAAAFLRFTVASVLSITLNAGLMYLSVTTRGWPYGAGLVLATVVVPPINFAVNYLWAFRPAVQRSRHADISGLRNASDSKRRQGEK